MHIIGFPYNSDVMQVLNLCILFAKYYIHIQHLFNNNTLDLYAFLNHLKCVLKTDKNICKTEENICQTNNN